MGNVLYVTCNLYKSPPALNYAVDSTFDVKEFENMPELEKKICIFANFKVFFFFSE